MEITRQLRFDHDAGARRDQKIISAMVRHGPVAYAAFFMTIEKLAESDGWLYCDYDGMAYEFHIEKEIVKSVIEDFDLFVFEETTNGKIFKSLRLNKWIENIDVSLKKRSEAGKKGMASRWKAKSMNSDNGVITNDNNVITEDNNVIANDNGVITNDNYNKDKDKDKDKDNNPPPLNTRAKNENDPCLDSPALMSTIAMEKLTESLIDRLKGDEMKQVGIITGNPELITKDNFNEMVEKFRSWMRITERRSQSYGQMCGTFLSWLRIESKDNPNNNSYGKSRNGETEKVSQKLRDLRYGGTSDADAYSAPI